MTNGRHVPELVLSNNAENALLEYGILTWATLFSILFDPEVDGEFKRRHASDIILFDDGGCSMTEGCVLRIGLWRMGMCTSVSCRRKRI